MLDSEWTHHSPTRTPNHLHVHQNFDFVWLRFSQISNHLTVVGLRAVTVQYGLDGPVLRPRTRAVKCLVNQPDGRYTGRNQPSKTVQCTAVTALDGFGRRVSILELFFSVSLMYYTVGKKTVPMFGCFGKIDLLKNK
jgi:hypothetical protein